MRSSIVPSPGTWEPRLLFLCLTLIVTTSFELQGLAKDLGWVLAPQPTQRQPSAPPDTRELGISRELGTSLISAGQARFEEGTRQKPSFRTVPVTSLHARRAQLRRRR